MPTVNYAKAQARRRQVLICLIGESTSGKTYSALMIAWGLARKLATPSVPFLMDTENGRGEMYDDDPIIGGYNYGELTPPFTPERFIEGIDDAEKAGAKVMVTDTFSHEWEGQGGIIEIAESATTKGGFELNGLVKWSKPKSRHKKLMHYLGRSIIHHILVLRAKDDMEQVDQVDENTKKTKNVVINKGKKSVQEKRFKFEMTVQLIMDDTKGREGYYTVSKCPKPLQHIFKDGERISVKTGELLAEWCNGAKKLDPVLEKLRMSGETAAAGGKKNFLEWWQSKEIKPHWEKLKPFMDNFSSISKTADDTAVQAKLDEETSVKTEKQAGRSKTAPFDDPANPVIPAEE